MGLDMYLSKRNKQYEGHELQVGYWRKANQIHKWFVDNIQNGVDECQESEVDLSDLKQLKDICVKALKTRNSDLLPTCEGFFFGSTEINEYYWQNIKDTIEQINSIEHEAGNQYFYQASW